MAQINSGVGNTQYTTANSKVATSEPSVTDRPSAIATIVTQINSHARLKRKRGRDTIGREERVFVVGSVLGMIHELRAPKSLPARENHTIAAMRTARRGWSMPRPWASRICRLPIGDGMDGFSSASQQFLGRLIGLEFRNAMPEAQLQLSIDQRKHAICRCRAHPFYDV